MYGVMGGCGELVQKLLCHLRQKSTPPDYSSEYKVYTRFHQGFEELAQVVTLAIFHMV